MGKLLPIAVIVYFTLSYYASAPLQTPSSPLLAHEMMLQQLYKALASVGQYIIPGIFCFGALISVLKSKKRQKLYTDFARNQDVINDYSWREFEMLISEAFRQKGFSVTETGQNGPDGGVDLELSKDGQGYLVQCKHWKSGKVPVGVVRELFGVMCARHALGGYVVASDGFTEDAKQFAFDNGVTLIGRDELISMINSVDAQNVLSEPRSSDEPLCPRCGSNMVKRRAKRGENAGNEFWGCARFPKCRGIVN